MRLHFIIVLLVYVSSAQLSSAGVPHDCICPFDETILVNPGTQSCGQIKCPACGHHLVRALYVGAKQGTVVPNRNGIDGAAAIDAQNAPQPIMIAAPAPAAAAPPAGGTVTYTNTIAGIIEVSCARCHDGPLRNLMTYQNVKPYVDNGLLAMLVRQGGPMNRFAGKNAQVIIDWAKSGAPK
jgi:hypothetical protein